MRPRCSRAHLVAAVGAARILALAFSVVLARSVWSLDVEDLSGQDTQLRDQVARAEMAVEGVVVHRVVEGAFDEDCSERPRGDLGCCNLPDTFVARFDGYRVRLDVAKDDHFAAGRAVAYEECRALNGCQSTRLLRVVVMTM